MAKPKKQEEESCAEGAPLWIISFADMMSLLMAFFVMLSTFSNFGPKEEQELKGVLKAALAPYGGWLQSPPKTGMGQKSTLSGQTPAGSEKPTGEQGFSTDTLAETGKKDFRTQKVFVTDSANVFWSDGITISKAGRDYLSTMAAYLLKLNSRIVIAEGGTIGPGETGINRSIVIAQFLASKGISADNLNIAPELMTPTDKARLGRRLEITILEEGIYRQ